MRVHLCDRPFATVPAIFERNEFRRESQIVQTRRNCTIPYNFPLLTILDSKNLRKLRSNLYYTIVQLNIYKKGKDWFFYTFWKFSAQKLHTHFLKKNLWNEKFKISVFILNNSSKIHYYKTKTVEMSRITYFIIL